MKTQVKRETTAQWHASSVSPMLYETIVAVEQLEQRLTRELRGAKTARRRLSKAVIKANRARWSAENLARTIDANLSAGV